MKTRYLIAEAYLHVLAFALIGMGVAGLLGFSTIEQPTPHKVVLLPDSALMAVLMGSLLLAATRQATQLLALFSALLGGVALYTLAHNQLAGGADNGQSWLSGFLRMRSGLALILLVAIPTICLCLGSTLSRRAARLIGMVGIMFAVWLQSSESLDNWPASGLASNTPPLTSPTSSS